MAEVDGEYRRSETCFGTWKVLRNRMLEHRQLTGLVESRHNGESRTSGSKGGPGKRTSRKAGTAPWSDPYLQRLVTDYIDHHNTHQPHQSLEQRPPTPPKRPA